MKSLFINLLLVISFWGIFQACSKPENNSPVPNQLSLQFEEELTIGSDTSASLDAQLASPAEVRTDSEGNIYVSDRGAFAIKVFDSEGNYLHSIGQEGGGPGEFGDITGIEINDHENLIVMDAQNERITIFSKDGSLIANRSVKSDSMIWPRYFSQINADQYLILRKLRETPGINDKNVVKKQSSLLHLYNREFNNYITSFAHIDSVMDASSGFVQHYTASIHAGKYCYSENGDVWYVPGIYNATIYRFSEGTEDWERAETVKGDLVPNKSVELTSKAEGAIAISTYTREGMQSFSGYVKSESLGLFQLDDGRMVHISSQLDEGNRVTVVEVFSPEGVLQGMGQLDAFTYPKTDRSTSIESIYKDEDDRFYIIENRGIPVVRVGRIGRI